MWRCRWQSFLYTESCPIRRHLHACGHDSEPAASFILGHLNLDAGTWHAEVYITAHDLSLLPENVPRSSCLRTCDPAVLKGMQSEWQVTTSSGGDMATPISPIRMRMDHNVTWLNPSPWTAFIRTFGRDRYRSGDIRV